MLVLPTPNNPTHLREHYDVLILGADLGAAVVASRLAASGKQVAVLLRDAALSRDASWGQRPFAHADGAFANPAWPEALRTEVSSLTQALARVQQLSGDLNNEGDLTAALLGDAAARGAHIFVGCDAKTLQTSQHGFRVGFALLHVGRELFNAPPLFVNAAQVVVSLGAQSGPWLKATGLTLSATVGATCAMGSTGETGGSDAQGRVFTGQGVDIHRGLFVAGSALCPSSVGLCPTLSLAAIVDRNATLWNAPTEPLASTYTPLPAPPPPAAAGLHFTEAMKGFVSSHVTAGGAFEAGFRRGKQDNSALVFVLTLATDSVEGMSRDPKHPARSVGTVVAPALDEKPLLVAGGDFNLFVDQADGSRRMKYRMQLICENGRRFFFDGFKVIRDDPGVDVWPDTTTLYITIFDGPTDASPVWGRGMLHIAPADFAKQLTTFKAFGARNSWQKLRAQVAFGRLFLGSLFETYVGAAAFLPDVRKPGGLAKLFAAKLGWVVFSLAAVLLWIWPWRPGMLRNQAWVAPDVAAQLPAAPPVLIRHMESLVPFARMWQGLQLDEANTHTEALTYHCDWIPDNIVQTHGGMGDVPFHPEDIERLSEPNIRRGFLNLTRIRDGAGRVVGIGSQLETIIVNRGALSRTSIDAYTDWTLLFPGRGFLFLGQVEGGPDLTTLHNQAVKTKTPWRGLREVNRSLGPLLDLQGIVHAGTAGFRNAFGSFREFNIIKEVPVEGDTVANTRYELKLLYAPPAPHTPPQAARDLNLPAHATRALNPNLAWQPVKRRFSFDLDQDRIYETAGKALASVAFPTSLGPLVDEDLAFARVFLAKLRDEHGAVAGLAFAASHQDSAGRHYITQWTLLISGIGTLYVAPDETVDAKAPARGYLGSERGLIVGGTGQYYNTAGVVTEAWPGPNGRRATIDVTLLTSQL